MPSLNQANTEPSADVSNEERLKAALWYSIGQTVDAVAMTQDINASPRFIGGLSELVWAQIETAAKDLEAFAKHAGRSTITAPDVVLLGRRNAGLEDALRRETKVVQGREGA